MLNAREDHVEQHYGFTYQAYTEQTGCTWITVQNEIAYLKEVVYNKTVTVSSKIIELGERLSKIEILMRDEKNETIHAVLWMTIIYFDLRSRKSAITPPETMSLMKKFYLPVEETSFAERVNALRKINKTM